MIRALKRLIRRPQVAPLQAEIERINQQIVEALKEHKPVAHLRFRLMDKRHALMRAMTGV